MTKKLRQSHHGGALNTLSHSLTIDQWQQALESAKRYRSELSFYEDRRDPSQTRHDTVRRCLLRVDRGDAAPGLYVVRSRDISDGGIRIVHGGQVKPQSVCCIIIETENGQSIAAGGEVSWCNPIKDDSVDAYELGIQFYVPINASCFGPVSDSNENVA